MYEIHEVDGVEFSYTIDALNRLDPYFPELQERHIVSGYWWLVYLGREPVGFAGMVPMEPFPGVGYFKRCLVKPGHYGGIQLRAMAARDLKARQLGWTMLVSECHASNSRSAANFLKFGFEQFEPEQPWAKDSIFFKKTL
jgi:RimJ/RimL family protein N-acetyltransferase